MTTLRLLLTLGAASAALTACGGGGDTSPPPAEVQTEIPASAAASPAAYTQFTRDQPADETSEPLGLNLFAEAPTSETDDPVTLN